MTCRHSKNDPNCSSHKDYVSPYTPPYSSSSAYSTTPDSSNYSIMDVERVGKHLVMKILYPNCSNCSYEGKKVMVFLNVKESDVLKWKKIDPHFKDPKKSKSFNENVSPAARFPASDEGWLDAINYAKSKG